jgi:Ca2+-binding RTX toxin-like protein
MSTRSRLITFAVLVTAAFAPGAAHAATSCSYQSIGVSQVTISMTAPGDAAKVSRAGDAIQVNGGGCGFATIYNTSKILWQDTSNGGTTATVDLSGGQFANIDFDYSAGSGADTFNVWGTPQNDAIRIGSDGLDSHVNLDVATDPTADVDLESVEIADLNGGGGDDVLDAGSHFDTGGQVFGGNLYMEGAAGGDSLTGGSGVSELAGGSGNDLITAGSGMATITPGTGDDTAIGAFSSKATVSYGDAPAGVQVDLSHSGSQDTGGSGNDYLSGFNVLIGSPHDDVLAGTTGAETIDAGDGNDSLDGHGGNDVLQGGDGTNIASYANASKGVTVSLTYAQGFAQDTGDGLQRLFDISGLTGSSFDDVLTGDAAANRIEGGGGADTINAGDGADTVLLRDGISDHADCGGASDTVQSDVAGLDVLTGCEQVTFAPFVDPGQPGGGGAVGGGSADPGATADTTLTFRFSARAHQRLARRGIVKGSLLCPDEACAGELSAKLTIGHRARRAAHRTTQLAAGTAKVMNLKLGARNLSRARVALRQGKRVSLKVTAVARDAAGNRRTVTRTIRLRA